jgi:hypothetical protein
MEKLRRYKGFEDYLKGVLIQTERFGNFYFPQPESKVSEAQRIARELGDRVLAGIAALEVQRNQAAAEVLSAGQEYQDAQRQYLAAETRYEQAQQSLDAYDLALTRVREGTEKGRLGSKKKNIINYLDLSSSVPICQPQVSFPVHSQDSRLFSLKDSESR